jgi:hypothetical protein
MMPAEQLPPLNARLLERYVQARIDAMLMRLVSLYWSGQEVSLMHHYGTLGAIAEMKALVADAERSQRKDGDEVKTVSGPDYGRRSTRG